MFVEGIDKENLPEGWRIGTIKELCEVRDGTHDSPNYIENGYPLLTSIHLSAWKLLLDKACLISEQDYNKINERSLVETKDILFSMIGTVGVISFVLYTNIKFAVKNIAIFKTSHNLYFAEYLLFFLKSKEMQILIKESMSGSTQNYITLNTLRDIPIIIPNKDKVKQFHNVTNKIVSQIWNITQDNEKLIELQSLLLAKMGK
jgi:type I restriction enzyme S subunit